MHIASIRRVGGVLDPVSDRRDSRDNRCTAESVSGLQATESGDLAQRVTPVTILIVVRFEDPAVDAIAEETGSPVVDIGLQMVGVAEGAGRQDQMIATAARVRDEAVALATTSPGGGLSA